MKKQLLIAFALALMVPWASQAQTTTPVSTFPYSCDFESVSENSEWTLDNGTFGNEWVIDTAENNTTGGSTGLYISNNSGASSAYTVNAAEVVYAYRELDLTPGEYSVSFDWKCYGESTYDYILAAVVPSTVTLTAASALPTGVSYTGMTAEGWMNIGPRNGNIKMNLSNTWQTQNSFFSVSEAGTYKLVFLWRNDGSSGTAPGGCIDNVTVDAALCARPVNLAVSGITYESATLSWLSPSGNTTFRLYMSTQPEFGLDTCTYQTVTDTFADITGLDQLTTYYWAVVSDCGSDGVSGICGYGQFTTLRDCGPGYVNINNPIGNGTSSSYMYFTYNYNSSTYALGHSANIYTAEELAEIGLETGSADIGGLSLHAGSTPGVTPLKIYIGETTLSEFSGATDTVGLSNMMLVFDDSISSVAGEWVYINFDSVFHYTGNGNLIVYFYRPGLPNGNGTYYYTTTSPVYRSFYGYRSATSTSNLSFTRTYNRVNIKFDMCSEIPSCTRPTDLTISTTTTSASLEWEGCDNATEYLVTYSMSGLNPVTLTTSTPSILIDNLVSGTTYEFEVRSVCGSDTTFATTESATTECAVLSTLPYVQTFEGAETSNSSSATFVNCMFRLNNGTAYFGYPYVSATAGYNHTPGGSKGTYWYGSTTTGTYGDYQIVAMPAVDTITYPINTLQLRFWARTTSSSYMPVVQVGVMTDSSDATSFVPVQTITVEGMTYTEYTAVLGNYTGYGQYVAIRALRPTSSWYMNIDDITLEEMPLCPGVTDIQVNATVSSALLSWNWQEGYEAPANYVVTYDSVGSTGNPSTLNVTTNSAILSGLAPATTYKAYVQADCGDDGMGLMDSVEFVTSDFGCVQLDPATVDTVQIGSGTSTSYYLPIGNYYHYSYTQQLVLASELNGATTFTGIDFQYAYSSAMTDKTDVTIYMANVAATSLSSGFVPYTSSFQEVYSGALNCTQGWNHFEFDTPFDYNGTGNLLIVIYDNSDDYNGSSYVFNTHSASGMGRYVQNDSEPYDINNIPSGTAYNYRANMKLYAGQCLSAAVCAAPSMMVAGVEATSVTLAWAPGADETSWDVDYRLVGDSAWTNAATGVSTNNYTVTGLTDATSYEFRVSFTCSDAENTVYASYANATTNCLPKTMPYTENFDGITTSTTAANAGVMPTCWNFTMTGNSTYQAASYYPGVYYSANYAASGNYSLRLYGNGIFELPEMGASLDSLRLTFTDTITSTSYGLIVGVMDNDMFLPVDTLDLQTGVRNYAEVVFRNYTGSSRTIALKNYYTTSTTTYYSYHYIDDIAVDYIPVCAHVDSLTLDSISQTTATISWVPVNDETEWIVSDGTTTTSVNTTSHTFTGLTPNTPYTFEVRSVCGAGDTSEVFSVQGRTDCALLTTVPFVEDFESYAAGSSSTTSPFIPCWTRLNNGTSYGGYPYVGNSTSYNHTLGGGKGLYWYASTTTGTYGDYMYIILPEIDVTALPVNTLQLSFWAKSSSTSYAPAFEVGVMNSNADTAFQVIDSFTINGNTEWSEFVVPFDSYTGNGSFVAIRAFRPASTWYMYVDDISLDLIPACPRVEDVTASNVLTTSATISWTDTSSNSAWNIEYDTVAFTPGTNHMTAIHVTDTFAVLSGLDSATLYHVYVYPDCDGDVYFRHYTFTTLAASPATVPYVCNFEAEGTNGWDLINGSQTNRWMVGNAVNNGGNRSLYITNNDSSYAYTVSSITYVFASRNITLAAGNYICAFDWKAQGESSFDFIRAALVPASTQLVPGDYSGFNNTDAMPAGGIAVDGAYRLNLDSTWNTQVTEFQVTNADVYKLVFLWRNDGSGGTQPPAAIDNVSLVVNTCPRVTDVIALPSSNSMDLSWTPGGTETSWEVTVGTTTTVVNTPAYTATGLLPDTNYTVSIRAICGAGDTSFAVSDVYHTPCSAVSLPFSENFDTYTTSTTAATGVQVPCWNAILDGTATYQTGSYVPQIYYSSSNSHSGSYSYRLYGMGFHMLPPMPTSLDSLQLTFWDYTSSSSYGLEVGVMEGNTFIPVQTISTPTSTHVEHTVYFGSYTGNSRIIAFRNRYTTSTTTYYSYHYIDDVQVDYLPSCPPVVGINAASASTNSITVDWTDQASASMWQIEYGTMGHTLGTGTRMVVTSHPYVVNGLDTLTSYDFYVRPICSSTDTGLWSPAVSLSTAICDASTEARNFDPAGSSTTSTYGPIGYSLYNYSYVQTIIDSADLVALGGDITAFGFEVGAFLSGSSTKFENMTVYMANVSESNLSSGFIHPDANHSFQKVIDSANFNYTTSGWQIHSLDSAFTWDGHSNILVSVKRDNGTYSGSQTFIAHTAAASKMRYVYQDSGPYDASTVTGGTATTTVGNIRLISCGVGICREPSIDTVLVGETTAALSWTGLASSYEVYAIAGTWDEPTTGIATTGTSYTFTDLTPGTEYSVGVRAVCPNGTSEWVYVTITTDEHPCFVPTDLTFSDVTFNSATLSWTPGEAETEWDVHITGTNYDQTFTVTTNPYIATGLASGVEYTATVRARCSATQQSDWSNPVTFTTATCQPVSNVTVDNRTTTTAQVHWTAPAGVSNFDLEYGASGFAQGTGTHATATTNSITLSGLTPGTMYDVYVRSACGDNVYSSWSNVVSFETEDDGEGIEDVNSANIALYPNPATTTVTLTGFDGQATVTIVDMNGRKNGEWRVENGELTIDLTGYAQGAYFVRITGEQVNAIRKLIVK